VVCKIHEHEGRFWHGQCGWCREKGEKIVEENKNEFVLPKEYLEHENTVRVSGGSGWYGLAWCVVNKLRETRQPVDLVFMGGVPAWQCMKSLGAVFEDNGGNLFADLQYVRTAVHDIKKRAVLVRICADDYDSIQDPVKWVHVEEDLN